MGTSLVINENVICEHKGAKMAVKRRIIREVVIKEKLQLLCVKETKKELIIREICCRMWGSYKLSGSFLQL